MKLLLLGQPNVGKTSIYNILTNRKKNIIHSTKGTTRNWHSELIYNSNALIIHDTPGIEIKNNKLNFLNLKNLLSKIDLVLYVVDYNNSENDYDKEAINQLRKLNKKIILIINKDDNFLNVSNFSYLGIKELFFISCAHKLGFEKIFEHFSSIDLSKYDYDESDNYDYSLAIYGKPNVGKSTILNNLLGFERSRTSSIAGTTTDIVEDKYIYKKKIFKILDTAGIFRKSKIDKKSTNYMSIKNSLESIHSINLGLLIIDSTEGLDRQSKRIFNLLINKANSLFIVFNKIDLIKNKKEFYNDIKYEIENTITGSKNITLLFISAKSKNDIIKLKSMFLKKTDSSFNMPTNKINNWLKKVTFEYSHPLIKGKEVKFKYATQVKNKPITIKIFSNFSKQIKDSYKNYLINSFNKTFKIKDSKIKLVFTNSPNPYVKF